MAQTKCCHVGFFNFENWLFGDLNHSFSYFQAGTVTTTLENIGIINVKKCSAYLKMWFKVPISNIKYVSEH